MADGTTAADRLERVLHILPAACVDGGVSLDRLAAELDAERQTLLDDLAEVQGRSYYLPAGTGTDLRIAIEVDRVSVETPGPFRRPVKLSPREALCLALGLRSGGMRDDRDGAAEDGRLRLLERVERHLATEPVPAEVLRTIHAPDVEPDAAGIREILTSGARHRIRCRIRYLKPGDPEPETRVIHPYRIAHSEGRWYAIGWCEASEGGRAFRVDRILDARLEEGRFEPRPEVDADDFLRGGRVFHADSALDARVRYSSTVARWVTEWASRAEPAPDGSVVVRHRVSDPDWLVRHVVAYGGEAEVLDPPELRDAVRRAAAALAGAGEP